MAACKVWGSPSAKFLLLSAEFDNRRDAEFMLTTHAGCILAARILLSLLLPGQNNAKQTDG
jgi:hypothetical protein